MYNVKFLGHLFMSVLRALSLLEEVLIYVFDGPIQHKLGCLCKILIRLHGKTIQLFAAKGCVIKLASHLLQDHFFQKCNWPQVGSFLIASLQFSK